MVLTFLFFCDTITLELEFCLGPLSFKEPTLTFPTLFIFPLVAYIMHNSDRTRNAGVDVPEEKLRAWDAKYALARKILTD